MHALLVGLDWENGGLIFLGSLALASPTDVPQAIGALEQRGSGRRRAAHIECGSARMSREWHCLDGVFERSPLLGPLVG